MIKSYATDDYNDPRDIIKPREKEKRIWSTYQKTVFKEIRDGNRNVIVIARAGSAKSSSLVEGARYLPKGQTSLFCAFNKSIQEELSSKLPKNTIAKTLHSLGYQGIRQRFGSVELDNYKCWKLAEKIIGGSKKENYDLIDQVCKAVGLCKATLSDIPSKMEEVIDNYSIDLCDLEVEQFIKYIAATLRACKEQTNVIDYNDMIYFPFVYKINVGKYDTVFLDEAHDLSKLEIELALSAVKMNGRLFAVIDNRQAIYAFKGADIKVLDNFRTRLNPIELSLPICYRCPRKVVELVKPIVPDIQVYDNAIDGEIIKIGVNELIDYAKPNSYVVSRYNAPIIKHALNFLKRNIPANILGRDIGDNLMWIVKKSKKKKVPDLLKWLINWEKKEKENLITKYPKADTSVIADKAECIRMLCEEASDIKGVKDNINKLFKDAKEKDIVLFSSIHKIKGKESNTVFVLTDTLRSFDEVEINLGYVAFSRCKQKLYLVAKDVDNIPFLKQNNLTIN